MSAIYIKHGAVRPPHWPQVGKPQQTEPTRRTATQEDLRVDMYTMASYTSSRFGKLDCDSIDEVLNGEIGDRGTNDSDEVKIRRIRLRQQLKAERAGAVAASGSNFDATMIGSDINDDVEKILRKEVLGPEASARLDAQFAEQERKKKEAAELIHEEKKQAGKADLMQALGQEEYDRLMSTLQELDPDHTEARVRISAGAERRHPQKMSAEEKRNARRTAKRSGSRQMGLIIGEKRSWNEDKGEEKTVDHHVVKGTPNKDREELVEEIQATKKTSFGNEPERDCVQLAETRDSTQQELLGRLPSQANIGQCRKVKTGITDSLQEKIAVRSEEYRRDSERIAHRIRKREYEIEKKREATRQGVDPMQLHKTLSQICRKRAIESASRMLILTVLCHSLSWSLILYSLSRHTSMKSAVLVMVTCMLKDLFILYVHQDHLWYSEKPGTFASNLITRNMVSYLAWGNLMSWCGLSRAAIVVWLVPVLDNCGMRSRTYRWYRTHAIPAIQGPFPVTVVNDGYPVRLMSFEVNLSHAYLLTVWNRMIETVGYALIYLTLFSQDSCLSKILGLTVAVFLRSRFCPQPQAIQEGQVVDRLIRRELRFAMDIDHKDYLSFRECFDQQVDSFRQAIQKFCKDLQEHDRIRWVVDEASKSWTNNTITVVNTMITVVWLILSLRETHVLHVLLASVALGVQLAKDDGLVQLVGRLKMQWEGSHFWGAGSNQIKDLIKLLKPGY